MRGIWSSAVWLKEKRKITKQLLLWNRLSTHLEVQCAGSQVVDQSEVLQGQEDSEKYSSYSRIRSFIYATVGFGTGLIISAILRARKDEWTKSKTSLTHILPSVSAASPFTFNPEVDLNNNETKPPETTSKGIIHNFIADAVEKASDKVVYIDIKDARRSPYIKGGQSLSNGSGFIVSEDGLILTNAHVVTNRPRASSIMVRLHDGSECEGFVEDIDSISDLALIRVKRCSLSPAPLGKSSDLRPGEFVAALGSPLSLCNTVTAGVVSSVGRASKELGLRGRDIHYIQTDAAITFGNSGGPLINMDGEVIGINCMTVTSGISFAIPIDYAKEFIAKAEKKRAELARYPEARGPDRRRYLGITMLTLTPSIMQELQSRGNMPHHIPADLTHGILVWKIVVGSPAYQAGLQPGDIITHINNHDIHSSRDVYKFLEGRGEMSMTVIRSGQRYFATVVPEE